MTGNCNSVRPKRRYFIGAKYGKHTAASNVKLHHLKIKRAGHAMNGPLLSNSELSETQFQSCSGYKPCVINLRMSSTTRGRSSRYVTPNHEALERNTWQRAWPLRMRLPTVIGM